MDGGFQQYEDARSLWARIWREIYGQPPPLADDPELLGRILIESLPSLPPYELGRPLKSAPPHESEGESNDVEVQAFQGGPLGAKSLTGPG